MSEVAEAVAEQEVKPKKTRGKSGAPAAPASADGAPVEKKERKVGVRGSSKFSSDATITILSEKNPKRVGSKAASDWELYRNGMTVKEAQEAGISMADLLYNSSHKFIAIDGYDAPEPRKQIRKSKVEAAPNLPEGEAAQTEPAAE